MLADKLQTRCAASRRAPATTRSMPICGATRAAFSALHDSGGGQHPARRVALQRASARPSRSFATSSTSLRSSPNHSREWDSQPTRRGVGIFGRVRVPGVRARVRVRPTCHKPRLCTCMIVPSPRLPWECAIVSIAIQVSVYARLHACMHRDARPMAHATPTNRSLHEDAGAKRQR